MTETRQVLLEGVLTTPEQVLLAQLTQMGGYKVLMKLFDAASTKFQEACLKLDPESPTYEKQVASRTQRARNSIEYASLVFDSVASHVKTVGVQAAEQEEQQIDAVAKTFGIHRVPPKTKKVIGQQVIESPKGSVVNESK